jgi:hypothetical protein
MDVTLAEWFLIGTNLCTLFILGGLLRDSKKMNDLFVSTIMKIADGKVVVKRDKNGFYIVPKGEDDGIQK